MADVVKKADNSKKTLPSSVGLSASSVIEKLSKLDVTTTSPSSAITPPSPDKVQKILTSKGKNER